MVNTRDFQYSEALLKSPVLQCVARVDDGKQIQQVRPSVSKTELVRTVMLLAFERAQCEATSGCPLALRLSHMSAFLFGGRRDAASRCFASPNGFGSQMSVATTNVLSLSHCLRRAKRSCFFIKNWMNMSALSFSERTWIAGGLPKATLDLVKDPTAAAAR